MVRTPTSLEVDTPTAKAMGYVCTLFQLSVMFVYFNSADVLIAANSLLLTASKAW